MLFSMLPPQERLQRWGKVSDKFKFHNDIN